MIAQHQRGLPPYIRVFNTPWLAELAFSFGNFALLRRGLPEGDALRGEVLAPLSEPGALTAALNWYRAIPAGLASFAGESFDVKPPTLFLYGTREGWVNPARLEAQRALVRGPYEELELDAGHWLVEEQPAVIERILAHLERTEPTGVRTGRR